MLKHGPQVGCRFDRIVIKNGSLVRSLTKGREIPSCIWIHEISIMTSIYVQMVRTAQDTRWLLRGRTWQGNQKKKTIHVQTYKTGSIIYYTVFTQLFLHHLAQNIYTSQSHASPCSLLRVTEHLICLSDDVESLGALLHIVRVLVCKIEINGAQDIIALFPASENRIKNRIVLYLCFPVGLQIFASHDL